MEVICEKQEPPTVGVIKQLPHGSTSPLIGPPSPPSNDRIVRATSLQIPTITKKRQKSKIKTLHILDDSNINNPPKSLSSSFSPPSPISSSSPSSSLKRSVSENLVNSTISNNNDGKNTGTQPAYMGDILDDIFGGSFRTPGVKASEDILLTRTVTPAIAFEELEQIRRSPSLFICFFKDAKSHDVLESLLFILEVEEYTALPEEYRMLREQEIIQVYISAGSASQINVPESMRKMIEDKSGQAQGDIFLDAQKYVTHMLIRNVDNSWQYKKNPPKKELKGLP